MRAKEVLTKSTFLCRVQLLLKKRIKTTSLLIFYPKTKNNLSHCQFLAEREHNFAPENE